MTGFLRMTKLDFFTMKSQSVAYLSLIAMILLFGFMGSTVIILCITSAWFVALMSTNIFAIQEKNNLDRLYGSVAIELREIILGRYAFVILSYLVSFFAVVVLYSGFALFQDKTLVLRDIFLGFSLSFLVFSAIAGIQMPMFFKMGYTKARAWSMIPFLGVVALMVIPSFVAGLSNITEFMVSNQSVLIVGGILASCIFQLLSYRISVVLYQKRKRG